MFKALLRLPRNIWLIGLISLFNDGASQMLYFAYGLFCL